MAEPPDLELVGTHAVPRDTLRRVSGLLPGAVRAGMLAFLVTAFVGGMWSAVLLINLATTPALPWSAAVIAGVGWPAWRWLIRGRDPTQTPAARHRFRANSVPPPIFAWALLAGVLSVIALVGLWIVLVQLAGVPGRTLPDQSRYPSLTVGLLLASASLVGAVTEEAAFRGYFQRYLEGSIAAPMAIAATCLVMAPEHALTQGFVWTTLLFYLAVDVILGRMATVVDSILPGIIVHATGLLVFFLVIWPGDAGRPTVSAGGADLTFWLHLAQALGFTLLAAVVFRHLAGLAKPACTTPGRRAQSR